VGLGPFKGVRLDLSYQYLLNAVDASGCPEDDAYFCGPEDGARSLPLRPAHSLDTTLRWRIESAGTVLFARADAMSERPIDATSVAPGFVTLATGIRQSILEHAEVVVGLENLLDAYDPIYGPKPGRHVSFQLRVWE
jgi:hypothetical protein